MKELEKTKRISIASVITILVVLIAVLSYKRPQHNYEINTAQTLDILTNKSFFISKEEILENDYVIIDVRNPFNFERGHLPNAINMATESILSDDNTELLQTFKNENKNIVLYGNHPEQAIIPYMLLTQLGYTNLKIAALKLHYDKNELVFSAFNENESQVNIPAFIAQKNKEAALKSKPKPKPVKVTPKKKIIPKKKKKKMPVEGGC